MHRLLLIVCTYSTSTGGFEIGFMHDHDVWEILKHLFCVSAENFNELVYSTIQCLMNSINMSFTTLPENILIEVTTSSWQLAQNQSIIIYL